MSNDEQDTDGERERESNERHSENFDMTPAPSDLVREVASGLKSLSRVLPYDEYASVVYRIARVRWRCQLAASNAARTDESM